MSEAMLKPAAPMLPPKVVIFDLDGTLLNSIEVVTTSLAETLQVELGLEHQAEDLVWAVGPPIAETIEKLMPGETPERRREVLDSYRGRYTARSLDVKPYPGIMDALRALHARGIRMAIATSKQEVAAQEIVEHLGIDKMMVAVCGADPNEIHADKSGIVGEALKGLGISTPVDQGERVVMVGDRFYDVVGAGKNGIPTLFVTWAGTSAEGEADDAFAVAGSAEEMLVALGL
ncbi:MAG: HAD hydrolase-like protein [Actinomycetaceae bacterium]|nr:HAD hydrolase-like protein [Actinomycetaceae bacterium]